MLYRIIINQLKRLLHQLDVDVHLDNQILTIIIKLEHRILFRKIINLSIPV